MKIFKLSLLLFIPFISCMNVNNEKVNDIKLEVKTPTKETIEFNALVKGTGNPTIIFESGLGTPLNNWNSIQSRISANYKTISYDRRGIGESPTTDNPRTLDNLVSDLDLMIKQHKVDGPIVFVGHSIGGHIVRKYQELFPSKVAGMFLVDPTNEYVYDEIFNQMTPEAADSMKSAWESSYSQQPDGVYNEWKEAYNIDDLMRSSPLPTTIPITILVSYQKNSFNTEENVVIRKKLTSDWGIDRSNVKILSTTNSGHYIHLGEPEWVITELEAYLENLK